MTQKNFAAYCILTAFLTGASGFTLFLGGNLFAAACTLFVGLICAIIAYFCVIEAQ